MLDAPLEIEPLVDHRGKARSRQMPCIAVTPSYGTPRPHGVHAVLGIAAAFPGSAMRLPPVRAGTNVGVEARTFAGTTCDTGSAPSEAPRALVHRKAVVSMVAVVLGPMTRNVAEDGSVKQPCGVVRVPRSSAHGPPQVWPARR